MSIDRRPTAVCYKAFLGICSIPTALGFLPLPGSLADGPDVYGRTAAIAICFGCAISLLGLLWPIRSKGRHCLDQNLTGITIEQVGLVFISVGCGLYAGALLGVHLDQAILVLQYGGGIRAFLTTWFRDVSLAVGMAGGIGLAAAVQLWVIWRYRREHVIQDG